jgi:general secretion pathway protein E
MDSAMSSLTASDLANMPAEALNQRRLPFTFAKRHGVLLQMTAEGVRLAYRAGVSLAALAEAQRFVGQTFRPAANTSAGQGT